LPADDPRLLLLVAGKQKTASYERVARRHGVADRVIFAGPTVDPYAFYRAADFFVLPTRHDPCSLVVLEALAMGLPVSARSLMGLRNHDRRRTRICAQGPIRRCSIARTLSPDDGPETRRKMSEACLSCGPIFRRRSTLHALLNIYQAATSVRVATQ